MTTAAFDASASTPRYDLRTLPDARCKPWHRRIIRVAWLIARFVRRDPVSFELYRDRFGVSLRSFRRDIAILRDAGLYLDAHPDRGYELLCFRADREAG